MQETLFRTFIFNTHKMFKNKFRQVFKNVLKTYFMTFDCKTFEIMFYIVFLNVTK